MSKKFTVAVLCGGPSPERGISLNSARSAADHLEGDDLEVVPVYFDPNRTPYALSRAQLYSNTPSDFDFKLRAFSKPLSERGLVRLLKGVDLVFPLMHGAFGEDGEIQSFLERHKIPFVGSSSAACRACYDKANAQDLLRRQGMYSLDSVLITRGDRRMAARVEEFFARARRRQAVVKPAAGGSSLGVSVVEGPSEALQHVRALLRSGQYDRVLLERYAKGREFTAVVLENRDRRPVCLLPVEIATSYRDASIFDYRRKYLPSHDTFYHCPPRFSARTIATIRRQAAELFSLFGLSEFARFDGWLLDDGEVWFSDFNPVSGMEQNSFLFLQAARIGMSHRDLLRFIVRRACERHGIRPPRLGEARIKRARKPVSVLFGGRSAERQVSVMSGTNVWLKLQRSTRFAPEAYLLDVPAGAKRDAQGTVWRLPYPFTLHHTVEEIVHLCRNARTEERRTAPLRAKVLEELRADRAELSVREFLPRKERFLEFVRRNKFVFLALHGGDGENGTFQAILEREGVCFNGSSSQGSRLCMDKFETGAQVCALGRPEIGSAEKVIMPTRAVAQLSASGVRKLWQELIAQLGARILVKPASDGCSAGVARLYGADDLRAYVRALTAGVGRIAPGTLAGQGEVIELPTREPQLLLFERFIVTDRVRVHGVELRHQRRSGWIEVTVGVYGPRGRMKSMFPSLTVAAGEVLSVEEKFQGGTGVNITPPPPSVVPRVALRRAMRSIELVARQLELEGYARIDAFLHTKTGELLIIEVNTLPALTPSTVIYHQALAERPSMYPRDFLEQIVDLGLARYRKR